MSGTVFGAGIGSGRGGGGGGGGGGRGERVGMYTEAGRVGVSGQ